MRRLIALAVFILVAVPAPLQAEPVEFEAEDAVLNGVEAFAHSGASGGYRVRYFDQEGDYIFFNSVPSGNFLEITYSLGLDTPKQCSVYIDGSDAKTIAFEPTGSWDEYRAVVLTLPVVNSVKLQIDADDYAANGGESCASIDKVAILTDDPLWRSSLYPEDWRPGYKDAQGRFLHDFSYAGYHSGQARIPASPPGLLVDVTQTPYNADNTGTSDATSAIQTAINVVSVAGGGIVYLPAGTYKLKPPADTNYALRISYSGVVLRGAGVGQTFLLNDETYMRSKSVILVQPVSGGWHTPLSGSTVDITQDVDYPRHTVGVTDTAGFTAGDWVVLRTDCTDDFIDEHGMTGLWNSGLKGITFYRRVTRVDVGLNSISVDIPTRYYLKTRDNARIYKVAPHLEEVGIEHLSMGMRENLTGGLGSLDYSVPGTAAYEVHGSHFIKFYHVVNSWIQDVDTYRPAVNTNDWHTLSNIILLSRCRNVTIRNCEVAKPEYEGGGGNGYGYILSGSDCLVIDCTAYHTRHNYDFKSMWTSGNVIFRCVTRDGHLPSDFHMHLSPANLFDSMVVDNDYLDARYRPYGTTIHGQTTTESVFWNSYGTSNCGSRLIRSRQWKWGYVIGTGGAVNNVERGTQDNTAPEDLLEGQGQGSTLAPQSLYLDQFYRRQQRDLDFSGTVDIEDFATFAGYWMNSCSSPDLCGGCDFDNSGLVDAADLAGLVNDWLSTRDSDLNFSGTADIVDFGIFASYWMNSCSGPDWCGGCDFDNNGVVDVADIAEFANDWL